MGESSDERRSVQAGESTVGWVCALPIELAAATEMLDEEFANLPSCKTDTNSYSLGRIGDHNVVMACLPAGQTGNNPAAAVANQMMSSFPLLRFGVLVGIGGGVPRPDIDDDDIRLGDVIISQPAGQYGGVVQYDLGKTGPDGLLTRTGNLCAPPAILLTALAKLQSNDFLGKTRIAEHLSKIRSKSNFESPGPKQDTLYSASSTHVAGTMCLNCRKDEVVPRENRTTTNPVLFFGTIASGNQVMKHGVTRDRHSEKLGGILCFEMEAAGLMNGFPCLVIRGICDYADAHKNNKWQPYAAATAAACAKELLLIVPSLAPVDGGQRRPDFCDINRTDEEGQTSLYRNASHGDVMAVEQLLKHGADWGIADRDGRTPLWIASSEEYVQVVQLLLEQGADLTTVQNHGCTPLYVASSYGHLQVVRLLLENSADWAVEHQDGYTPLWVASQQGHLEVVKLLLSKGADWTKADDWGRTPLNIAKAHGHSRVVKVLARKGAK